MKRISVFRSRYRTLHTCTPCTMPHPPRDYMPPLSEKPPGMSSLLHPLASHSAPAPPPNYLFHPFSHGHWYFPEKVDLSLTRWDGDVTLLDCIQYPWPRRLSNSHPPTPMPHPPQALFIHPHSSARTLVHPSPNYRLQLNSLYRRPALFLTRPFARPQPYLLTPHLLSRKGRLRFPERSSLLKVQSQLAVLLQHRLYLKKSPHLPLPSPFQLSLSTILQTVLRQSSPTSPRNCQYQFHTRAWSRESYYESVRFVFASTAWNDCLILYTTRSTLAPGASQAAQTSTPRHQPYAHCKVHADLAHGAGNRRRHTMT